MRRLSSLDSRRLIDFSLKILSGEADFSSMTEKEKRMVSMFYYSIWDRIPEVSFEESFRKLIEEDSDAADEIRELLIYNRKRIKITEIPYEDERIPLDIYASYTRIQILSAFGLTDARKKAEWREGIKYIEKYLTDVLMVTLNKSEKDYIPSTMYNDYAVSRHLFSWESQSTTSDTSPTGKRYISGNILNRTIIFVRENKNTYGKASPFIFLGGAKYRSHSGSNPINVIWEMDHDIPEKIIREQKLSDAR